MEENELTSIKKLVNQDARLNVVQESLDNVIENSLLDVMLQAMEYGFNVGKCGRYKYFEDIFKEKQE